MEKSSSCRHEWVIEYNGRKLVLPFCRRCKAYKDVPNGYNPTVAEKKRKKFVGN